MRTGENTTLRTISDLLVFHSGLRPNAPALIDVDGRTLTFSALHEEVTNLATSISQAVRSEKTGAPSRVGIVYPNGLDMAVLLLATTTQGVAAPFNPKMKYPEYVKQFAATDIDAVIMPRGSQDEAAEAARNLSLPIIWVEEGRKIAKSAKAACLHPAISPDQHALVLMTSGSTGTPKIVPLTHRNVCRSAYDVAHSVRLTPADRCLVMWEQFHIGGLVDLLLAPLAAGSSLIAAGSFSADQFFALQRENQATWFQGVPTTLAEICLVAERGGIKGHLEGLRFLRCVAAALPPTVQKKLEDRFQVPVVRTLGMTEASPLITSTCLPPELDKPGSVGKSAGPEVVIMSSDARVLAPTEIGQVAIRGENVFGGYEQNTEANESAFVGDWFLTGDLGYFDEDGHLFLTGRAKEMINRGGEKISPSEVDDALTAYPGVLDAAAFAVPHPRLGEDIYCAVKCDPDKDVSGLRQFLTERLSPHKIPRQILMLDDLPKTPVGKIDRQLLAARYGASESLEPDDKSAPRTELEKLLAKIWKRELSLVAFGIDDDFASLDGDSLSAVRILVEIETALGAQVPDDVIENFTTIREIASRLAAHGLEPIDVPKNNTADPATRAVLSESIIFSGAFEDAERLLSTANGRSDLKLKLDFILAHLAPKEAHSFIQYLEGAGLDQICQSQSLIERMLVKSEFSQRLRDARGYLNRSSTAGRWQRSILVPSALHYGDPTVASTDKTLIVGFTGNRMRLSMPTYRFLVGIDVTRTDLLLLLDHKQRLFYDGIPGIGGDVEAIAEFVREFVRENGYTRIIGLGTSGGSLAALLAGYFGNFDVTVAIDPASLTKHSKWRADFEAFGAAHDPDALRVRLIYGRRRRHKELAHNLGELLPHADLIRYPYAGKNILPAAQDRGEFESLWEAWSQP